MTTATHDAADGVALPRTVAGPMLKAPTGVTGLDQLLGGGLPQGRPTLVCGGAGCGKTLLAMEFLCRGALEYGEPGVFIAFEERAGELATNAGSLGFDVVGMQADGLLALDHVELDPQQIVEAGAYDLEGLFFRIAASVAKVGAKRIAIDTVEVLFGSLQDTAMLRAELKRLFSWIKDQGLTAVVTAESGDQGGFTRHGIEEFVSDCVILLDHRITEQRSTRRLRVLKYRGSMHEADEFPFLIGSRGFEVAPITSLRLEQPVSDEQLSTGVARLDAALSEGVYRGSSVLVSGSAGSGKTTFAAHFAAAACRRGDRTLFVSYEEPSSQLARNMRSCGVDLAAWASDGLLRIESMRPTMFGLERHLSWLNHVLDEFDPLVVIIDPISAFVRSGTKAEATSMLMRKLDLLKTRGVTTFLTALTRPGTLEQTDLDVSSLIDTWLFVQNVEHQGERNRTLCIVKSRGMAHSNQVAEFTIGDEGIEVLEPYVGSQGVLTGSARMLQESLEKMHDDIEVQELDDRQQALDRLRAATEARVAAAWADFEAEAAQLSQARRAREAARVEEMHRRTWMGARRWATPAPGPDAGGDS